jgi:hypothetical protein
MYPIIATYTADTRFQASSSTTVQEMVVGAGTSTLLTASPNPAALSQAVTFTAVVRATQGGTTGPTGNVTLLDGSTVIGTAALKAAEIMLVDPGVVTRPVEKLQSKGLSPVRLRDVPLRIYLRGYT